MDEEIMSVVEEFVEKKSDDSIDQIEENEFYNICPNCGHKNEITVPLCTNCGVDE